MTARQSILVPLYGSSLAKHAIPYAQALTGVGSSVVFLQVVAPNREQAQVAIDQPLGWTADEELSIVSKARLDLDAFAKSGTLRPLPDVCVTVGEPAETILDVAEQQQSDLIVMTTHGLGAIKRALFGSVTDRVVRHSTVPILGVRDQDDVIPGEAAVIRRIIVPLDGSSLAEHALSMARKVARQLGVPILLVRALHLNYVVTAVDGALAVTQESIDDMRQYADEYLSAIQDQLMREGLDVSIATEWGAPFDVIDTLTRPDDLIVLTSHGRSGIRRWLLGSVAEKLIRTSRAPILLVPVKDTV